MFVNKLTNPSANTFYSPEGGSGNGDNGGNGAGDGNGVDPNANPNGGEGGTPEEVVILEIDGAEYSVDKDGNAVTKEGAIFKTKEQLDAEYGEEQPATTVDIDGKTYNLDEKGNAVDDKGTVVKTKEDLAINTNDAISIASLKQLIQIDPITRDGKPIEYDETPTGVAKFVKDSATILAQTMFNDGFKKFFDANPEIKDIYNYKRLHGTIENYKPSVDYSKVVLDATTPEDQIESMVIAERLEKGDTIEAAKRYVAFCKSDNSLLDAGKQSQEYLNNKRARQEEIINTQNAQAERERQLAETAYWDSVNNIINSGNIKIGDTTVNIPEVMQINKDGRKIPVTRADFLNYIQKPVTYTRQDGSRITATQNQIDMQEEQSKTTVHDEIYEALNRFLRKGKTDMVKDIINQEKVNEIRKRFVKKDASHSGQRNGGENVGGKIKLPVR